MVTAFFENGYRVLESGYRDSENGYQLLFVVPKMVISGFCGSEHGY